jgi:hypothetical protein
VNKLLVFTLTILTACTPAATLPTAVKIPVPVQCPPPPSFARPRLAIAALPTGYSPDQYVRAVESSLVALMGYAGELEQLLGGYRSGR